MMDYIRAILRPPVNPIDQPDAMVWADIENSLKIILPKDYKDFVSIYGSGCINDFIWIFNPASKNANIELLQQIKIRLGALQDLKLQGESFPYELYPAANGVIPFAATDNGDVFFLKPYGDDNYHIVINEGRSPVCEEIDLTWSNFVFDLISGNVYSKILPPNVFKSSPEFNSVG